MNAKTDDGSCEYSYNVPTTYEFTDADGNNTVSYSGQTARMDMLSEMTSLLCQQQWNSFRCCNITCYV